MQLIFIQNLINGHAKVCFIVTVFWYLREGPRSQGASWAVCGSGVPPYDFLNLYGISNSRFCISFS
jgi:hypothetical protein